MPTGLASGRGGSAENEAAIKQKMREMFKLVQSILPDSENTGERRKDKMARAREEEEQARKLITAVMERVLKEATAANQDLGLIGHKMAPMYEKRTRRIVKRLVEDYYHGFPWAEPLRSVSTVITVSDELNKDWKVGQDVLDELTMAVTCMMKLGMCGFDFYPWDTAAEDFDVEDEEGVTRGRNVLKLASKLLRSNLHKVRCDFPQTTQLYKHAYQHLFQAMMENLDRNGLTVAELVKKEKTLAKGTLCVVRVITDSTETHERQAKDGLLQDEVQFTHATKGKTAEATYLDLVITRFLECLKGAFAKDFEKQTHLGETVVVVEDEKAVVEAMTATPPRNAILIIRGRSNIGVQGTRPTFEWEERREERRMKSDCWNLGITRPDFGEIAELSNESQNGKGDTPGGTQIITEAKAATMAAKLKQPLWDAIDLSEKPEVVIDLARSLPKELQILNLNGCKIGAWMALLAPYLPSGLKKLDLRGNQLEAADVCNLVRYLPKGITQENLILTENPFTKGKPFEEEGPAASALDLHVPKGPNQPSRLVQDALLELLFYPNLCPGFDNATNASTIGSFEQFKQENALANIVGAGKTGRGRTPEDDLKQARLEAQNSVHTQPIREQEEKAQFEEMLGIARMTPPPPVEAPASKVDQQGD